ncbi:MAG TPA: PEGA domain-containing protein [Polyangiaceae bacterium]|jgi:tetratricopeptide (TPR) repeat protein|nr:PEGA domain-containing protein [Polyangiaceae bacterium]
MRRFASSFVLCASVCSLSAVARAEGAPSTPPASSETDVDQARQRFQRGAELYKEGSFDAALAEFLRAYELAPNYRVLYNIAQVELERHDYAAALKYYQDYLRQGGTDLPAERREQVEGEVRALGNRVSELTITSNVAGAELSIDGAPAGVLPLDGPVIVSAGVRRLSLRKAGYPPNERTLTVVGGDKTQLRLDIEDARWGAGAAPPASAARQDSSAPSSHTGLWIGVATTAALAGTAVVFGVLTVKADDKLDEKLQTFPGNAQEIDDARSKLKLYAGLTDGFAAGAVVSALVTTSFVIFGSSGDKSSVAGKNKARARLVAAGSGVRFEGRF